MGGFAWVTLATNDSYSLGALVLAHSLRQVGTRHQIAVLVTPGVTDAMREKLLSVFDVVQEVNIMDSKDEANLRLLQRPELGITFTKLHCWRLTQFEKCVFLDADILVVGNADELFDREELSAAPDVGWPDCFNSGVFVYRPSNETYEKLVCFALEKGSFDGGDQGLLNLYFSDWAHKDISKHLPFIYNMCSTAGYSYLPAFKQFGENVKIVHFIGNTKPWLQYFDTEARKVKPAGDLQHLQGVLQLWWDMFFAAIQPNLTAEMARGKSPALHNPPSFNHPRSYPDPTFISQPEIHEFVSQHDFKDVWDPWDEYEHHAPQTVTDSNTLLPESFEPHSTNAHENITNICAYQPSIQSLPQEQTYIPPSQSPPHEPEPQPYIPHSIPTPQVHSPAPPEHHPQTKHFPNEHHSVTNRNDNETLTIHTERIHYVQLPLIHIQKPILTVLNEPTCTVATESTLINNANDHHENETDGGLAGAFSHLKLGEPRSPGQIAYEDLIRRQGWEAGNIDYLGRDSFDNIWKKICLTIEAAPAEKPKGYQTEATALQPQETSPAVDPPAPTQTQQEIKPTPVTPTPTPESPQTPATTTTPSDPPHTPEEPQVQTQSQPELEETKPAAEDPKSSEPLQAITTTPKLAIAAPPQVQKPPIALPGPDELPAEPPKPEPVEPIKEIPLECPKPEPPKEIPVQPKDEPQKVEPAEVAKEAPAEAVKEAATEAVKEASTEAVKEAPAEAVKEVQEQLVCPRVQEKPLEKPVEATVEKPAPPQTKEKSPEKPEAPKSTEKAPEKPATPQAVQETPEKPAAVQVVETTPVEKAPEKPAVVDTTPTPPEAEAAPTAPQEEKPKAPEGKVPDTPPPAQASGPTPPPRKASGGGKKGGKKK